MSVHLFDSGWLGIINYLLPLTDNYSFIYHLFDQFARGTIIVDSMSLLVTNITVEWLQTLMKINYRRECHQFCPESQ